MASDQSHSPDSSLSVKVTRPPSTLYATPKKSPQRITEAQGADVVDSVPQATTSGLSSGYVSLRSGKPLAVTTNKSTSHQNLVSEAPGGSTTLPRNFGSETYKVPKSKYSFLKLFKKTKKRSGNDPYDKAQPKENKHTKRLGCVQKARNSTLSMLPDDPGSDESLSHSSSNQIQTNLQPSYLGSTENLPIKLQSAYVTSVSCINIPTADRSYVNVPIKQRKNEGTTNLAKAHSVANIPESGEKPESKEIVIPTTVTPNICSVTEAQKQSENGGAPAKPQLAVKPTIGFTSAKPELPAPVRASLSHNIPASEDEALEETTPSPHFEYRDLAEGYITLPSPIENNQMLHIYINTPTFRETIERYGHIQYIVPPHYRIFVGPSPISISLDENARPPEHVTGPHLLDNGMYLTYVRTLTRPWSQSSEEGLHGIVVLPSIQETTNRAVVSGQDEHSTTTDDVVPNHTETSHETMLPNGTDHETVQSPADTPHGVIQTDVEATTDTGTLQPRFELDSVIREHSPPTQYDVDAEFLTSSSVPPNSFHHMNTNLIQDDTPSNHNDREASVNVPQPSSSSSVQTASTAIITNGCQSGTASDASSDRLSFSITSGPAGSCSSSHARRYPKSAQYHPKRRQKPKNVVSLSPLSSFDMTFDSLSSIDKPVSEMSVSELATSMCLLKMPRHAATFRDRQVDGHLGTRLDAEMLKDDFNFSKFEALQFTEFVNGWRPKKK